jgi:hypothetical protein
LALKLSSRFVGIALGQLGHEVQRVGLDALLVFVEADLPVLAGGMRSTCLTFCPAVRRWPVASSLVQRVFHLLGHRVVLGRAGVLQRGPHAVADVHRAGGKDAVLLHEVHVHRAPRHDLARQVVQDGQVGAGLDDQGHVGDVRAEIWRRS